MIQTFTTINQKGGVGKSTTAHALATGLTHKGFRVLAVDLDPQGNLSFSMGADTTGTGAGEVLLGNTSAADAIIHTQQGDILPADVQLLGADITFTQAGKEYLLQKALAPLAEAYDYCVIDTPPSMGILSVNALTTATQAIVPVQADIFSLQGVSQLVPTYEAVKAHTNPDIRIRGLLLTRYSPRTVLSRNISDMAEEAARQLSSMVFLSTIREAVAVKEAQISQQSLYDYAPRSPVTRDYEGFVREVLQYG